MMSLAQSMASSLVHDVHKTIIFCWGKALQHASPTQATLCMGFHPLTAMLLGSLMLEEQITLSLFIGFFLVFIAILFIQIKSKS